jgi:hypothetical protein
MTKKAWVLIAALIVVAGIILIDRTCFKAWIVESPVGTIIGTALPDGFIDQFRMSGNVTLLRVPFTFSCRGNDRRLIFLVLR